MQKAAPRRHAGMLLMGELNAGYSLLGICFVVVWGQQLTMQTSLVLELTEIYLPPKCWD